MNMWEAVFFDMDGVIINSEPIHYKVNQKIYSDYGLNIDWQEYTDFVGLSNTDMWTILKNRYNLNVSVAVLKERQLEENLLYLETHEEEPIPGVLNLLEEFTSRGKALGLVSSSPRVYIYKVLDKFSIRDYFRTVVSGEEMERGKPEPDIYLSAASNLGVKPENCLVIEDSENGVRSAVSAGMKCVGLSRENEFYRGQSLDRADFVVSSFTDIDMEMLKKLFIN